jgi:hypothetical protein
MLLHKTSDGAPPRKDGAPPRNEHATRPRRGRPCTLRRRPSLLVSLVALAASALGASYVWNGGGSSDYWSDCGNWIATSSPPCYPTGASADAIFPWNASGAWTCDLSGASIDALTINGSVDFATDDATIELVDQQLVIDAQDGDVTVTLTGEGAIYTP